MKNKIALITGSTSGIGLGIAKHLASQGHHIVLNGFGDQAQIAEITQTISTNHKIKCLYHPANMAEPKEIKAMIEFTERELGSVDILINNAGIQHVSPIEEFPEDKLELLIRINLLAAFYTVKYSIPLMKKQGWGRILNIASAHAIVASAFKSAYVASKHGILGMTKSIALEVAEFNITANAICPGYVKTHLVLGQIADTAKAKHMTEDEVIRNVILGAQATKKFVEIEQIAGLVGFLCTDAAASITGTGIPIDGGWTAH